MSLESAFDTDEQMVPLVKHIVTQARMAAQVLGNATRQPASVLVEYAVVMAVTKSTYREALECLEECKTLESATGRLWLKAAERSFRQTGERHVPSYGKEKADSITR